ncbi:hypothetical protein AWH62_05935 [Maricaulis sp. W15]|uniref:hypothetical protein n=1 Tax=Maricaulis sp. W15 TaxID=1772333 RepID=UPI000948E778|nr:hypothetical protein [Maricaulis sp. W15]OLF75360.1 hypothetical protein AWH62_05935 [Maricaulis sp. W15]
MGKASWTILGSLKVAELVFGAETTMLNLRHAIAELPGAPGWRSNFDLLLIIDDLATLETFTPQSMKDHQVFMRGWNERYRQGHSPKTALVCADDLKRIIPELWSAMTREGWKTKIEVFTNRAEALAWLAEDQA